MHRCFGSYLTCAYQRSCVHNCMLTFHLWFVLQLCSQTFHWAPDPWHSEPAYYQAIRLGSTTILACHCTIVLCYYSLFISMSLGCGFLSCRLCLLACDCALILCYLMSVCLHVTRLWSFSCHHALVLCYLGSDLFAITGLWFCVI